HVRHISEPRTPTQAAEGLPRWRWTLDEFERFIDLGIFSEGDRVELIGGEIVPMSPKGNQHEAMRQRLHGWLRRNLRDDIDYQIEPGWRAGAGHYVEPDFLLHARGTRASDLPGSDALLVIEVSDASLSFDLSSKNVIYASLGVEEYWVIEARTGTTHVHRAPGAEGYGDIRKVPDTEPLTALRVPGLTLTLANLSL
ncbi:MAG: Uma2 family endonuclease, partial [Pseudomonadota bacterium]